MRIVFFLVAALCVGVGVAFGALNPQQVPLDFGVWRIPAVPVGLSLLTAALLGALAAGLVLELTVIWPLRRRLRRLAASAAPRDPQPRQPEPSVPTVS